MTHPSIRPLMSGLIDYAGLFPPAALDLKQAIANYLCYQKGEYSWILGRFVVPAARMAEVPEDLPVTVLSPKAQPIDGAESIEVKATHVSEIVPVPGTTVYYEIPTAQDPKPLIEAIARAGGRAKVRCGGDAVPSTQDLARFIRTCAEAKVAFKATAGLHHAIPGFLNLFIAAASPNEAERILEERDAAVLLANATPDQITRTRQNLGISFGSCSFEEPIADLKALGLL